MLVVAGVIASFVATVSRGNIWYVLTIGWALAGIVVANSATFPLVSISTASVGLMVFLAWLRAHGRRRRVTRSS